jgi:hypothetical protein
MAVVKLRYYYRAMKCNHVLKYKGVGARKLYKSITKVFCGITEREIQKTSKQAKSCILSLSTNNP